MTKRTAVRTALRAVATGTSITALLGLTPHLALAAPVPGPPGPAPASVAAAHAAATAPATLDPLARFFAAERKRSGAHAVAPGNPHAVAPGIPHAVAPGIPHAVAPGIPHAVAPGIPHAARHIEGGTVFHEPQIDAWYVQHGDRVEPLDADARRVVGAHGTTVAAYRKRVARAYGDKLPGPAHDQRGEDGGYGQAAAAAASAGGRERRAPRPVSAGAFAGDSLPVTAATSLAGAAALLALGLSASAALRRRRSA
ncbi:hypothetical protein [Streptomyces sp. NPDC015125]|uniref:hypothetical protein n=1 Tax=Streptomyces sp. NPDC015125 TaxID=3364938 RepID=UPI0037033EA7